MVIIYNWKVVLLSCSYKKVHALNFKFKALRHNVLHFDFHQDSEGAAIHGLTMPSLAMNPK